MAPSTKSTITYPEFRKLLREDAVKASTHACIDSYRTNGSAVVKPHVVPHVGGDVSGPSFELHLGFGSVRPNLDADERRISVATGFVTSSDGSSCASVEGIAICNPIDQFERKEGLTKAIARVANVLGIISNGLMTVDKFMELLPSGQLSILSGKLFLTSLMCGKSEEVLRNAIRNSTYAYYDELAEISQQMRTRIYAIVRSPGKGGVVEKFLERFPDGSWPITGWAVSDATADLATEETKDDLPTPAIAE